MHGFRADALAHAAELERCAARGFVAVGVDAVDHGARSSPLLLERLHASPNGALPVMLEVMDATERELPVLIDALVGDFGVDRDRVSMVGISMGGFLAYRAIAAGVSRRGAAEHHGGARRERTVSGGVSSACIARRRARSNCRTSSFRAAWR